MADHYLEFSETLTHLTDEETNWLQSQLETVHVIDGAEYPEDRLPDTGEATWIGCHAYRDMEDYAPDFGEDAGFDYSLSEEVDEDRGRYLWIHSEEHGCVDRVAHLVGIGCDTGALAAGGAPIGSPVHLATTGDHQTHDQQTDIYPTMAFQLRAPAPWRRNLIGIRP